MDNSLLIGLSRQRTLINQLNVTANNLANMNTSGFKAQRLMLEEYKMAGAEITDFRQRDKDLSYVVDRASVTDFLQGPIELSGGELDVAIEGEGFFVIQTAQGERYTRNGAFHLDAGGQLVDAQGNLVLGEGGGFTFTAEDGAIAIARDGSISTELGARGRIRVVNFDQPQTLRRVGDTLFTADTPPVAIEFPRVAQGALERSNVEAVGEITRMIEITRNYQTVSKITEEQNRLLRRSIESLATINS